MADEETRTEQAANPPQDDRVRRWLIRLVVLVVVFLLGFVPMWWSKRSVANDLDQTKRELRRSQLQNTLSAAAVYARRGEYETGRQSASSFFTELQAELDNTGSTVLTTQEKTQIPALFSSRDDVITLLSRNDPAAAERLSDLYVAYRAVTGVKQPQ
jgi:hypothetical protein